MGFHASDSEGLRAFHCGQVGELGGGHGGLEMLMLWGMVDKVLGWERRRTRGSGLLGAEATDETLFHGSDILDRAGKRSGASVSLVLLLGNKICAVRYSQLKRPFEPDAVRAIPGCPW